MAATFTIARLDAEAISRLLGEEAAANLKAKNRGGASSFKGFRYEELFGAHRIARLSRKLLQEGQDALVEWQGTAFVDDLVVRRDGVGSLKGYQLKNTTGVSWTVGNPSIETDFSRQYAVSEREGYSDIRLRLVCSNAATVDVLNDTVPQRISEYSRAFLFPHGEGLLPLLQEHSWMLEDFAYLSRKNSPTRIEVEQVAGVLIGAWVLKAPRAYVGEVIVQARDMSPTLLRSMKTDAEALDALSNDVRRVLDAIPGFEYAIMRGFLQWSAFGGSTAGVLSFDCFSERFQEWQRAVAQSSPLTFEALEGALV